MKKTMFLFAFILLFISQMISAATLTARVSQKQITMGSTFNLVLSFDGKQNGLEPNWQVLQKDFQMLGSGTSTSLNIINGKSTSKTQWVAILVSKHQGKVTVPAISLGQYHSQPVTIDVLPAGKINTSGKARSVFLQGNISSNRAYIGSQLVYTVKLYADKPVLSGSLNFPKIKNAQVRQLGQDSNYQDYYNGVDYRVLKRQYLITPRKSGRIIINSPIFTGQVVSSKQNNNNTPFGFTPIMGVDSQTIRAIAPQIILNIQPKPKSFTGRWWLPSNQVTLTQRWSGSPRRMKVGQPVTLTLTLKANGLTGNQLPNIRPLNIEGANSYPDRVKHRTRQTATGIVGSSQQSIAIVPTKTGMIEIPAIKVPWWNIQRGQMAYAQLPEQSFRVAPAAVSNTVSQTSQQIQSAISKEPSPKTTPLPTQNKQEFSPWLWLVLGLVLLWLLSLIAWRMHVRRLRKEDNIEPKKSHSEKAPVMPTTKETEKELKRSCDNNDPIAAKKALLNWASTQCPQKQFSSLSDIANHYVVSEKLTDAIWALDRTLYASDNKSWQGQELWEAITKIGEKSDASKKEEGLPPLYPAN